MLSPCSSILMWAYNFSLYFNFLGFVNTSVVLLFLANYFTIMMCDLKLLFHQASHAQATNAENHLFCAVYS